MTLNENLRTAQQKKKCWYPTFTPFPTIPSHFQKHIILDRIESNVVKGENAGYYQHFHLFPQCL